MKIIVEAAEDQAEEARQIVERRWSLAACRRPWPSNPSLAKLQGADLEGAQLQGADLALAKLQGTMLVGVFAWRADPLSAAMRDARVAQTILEPKQPCSIGTKRLCEWNAASLHDLRQRIEREMPAGTARHVLARLDAWLDPGKILDHEANMAARWRAAQASSPSQNAFERARVQLWQAIGCAASGSPYVVTALSARMGEQSHVFERVSNERTRQLATAFLDPACAGARGISEETRAKLVALSQPTAPVAGAR